MVGLGDKGDFRILNIMEKVSREKGMKTAVQSGVKAYRVAAQQKGKGGALMLITEMKVGVVGERKAKAFFWMWVSFPWWWEYPVEL